MCKSACRIDLEAGTAGSKGKRVLNFYKCPQIFLPGDCAIFYSSRQCVKLQHRSHYTCFVYEETEAQKMQAHVVNDIHVGLQTCALVHAAHLVFIK